jgi:hypothetical protein
MGLQYIDPAAHARQDRLAPPVTAAEIAPKTPLDGIAEQARNQV